MRVPELLQSRTQVEEIARIRAELESSRRQVSTGKRVHSPADDPASAARATRIAEQWGEVEQYRRSTDSARDRLLGVDAVLDQMERLMERAATLAAAGQSGDLSATKLAVLSQEVDALRNQLLALANSRHDGVYLFAGENTLVPAFDAAFAYQGDGQAPVVRISDQRVVETSIPGSNLLVGGLDAFQVLADLRDALATANGPAIASGSGEIEQVLQRFNQYRARIGHTMGELDSHRLALTRRAFDEEARLDREVSADLARSISDLALRQAALEASLGAGARILSLSLMNVLG
jgi:flagellar hook-associated protein 3 FlgL